MQNFINSIANLCIVPSWRCSNLSNQEWPTLRLFVVQMTTFAKQYTCSQPIHRWLSWTNNIGLCSSKLVPQVSHELLRCLCLSCLQSLSRCTVPMVDLDSERHPPRSKEHIDLISAEFELGQLWDKYGLVGNVEVITHLSILMCFLAIYKLFPSCRHSWAFITWFTPSTY